MSVWSWFRTVVSSAGAWIAEQDCLDIHRVMLNAQKFIYPAGGARTCKAMKPWGFTASSVLLTPAASQDQNVRRY